MTASAVPSKRFLQSRTVLLPALVVSIVLVLLMLVWSIMLGAADISQETVLSAIFEFDNTSFDHLVIEDIFDLETQFITYLFIGTPICIPIGRGKAKGKSPSSKNGKLLKLVSSLHHDSS